MAFCLGGNLMELQVCGSYMLQQPKVFSAAPQLLHISQSQNLEIFEKIFFISIAWLVQEVPGCLNHGSSFRVRLLLSSKCLFINAFVTALDSQRLWPNKISSLAIFDQGISYLVAFNGFSFLVLARSNYSRLQFRMSQIQAVSLGYLKREEIQLFISFVLFFSDFSRLKRQSGQFSLLYNMAL